MVAVWLPFPAAYAATWLIAGVFHLGPYSALGVLAGLTLGLLAVVAAWSVETW